MSLSARARWILYALAGAATAAAVMAVDEPATVEVVQAVSRPAPAGAMAAPSATPLARSTLEVASGRGLATPGADPFSVAGDAGANVARSARVEPRAVAAPLAPPLPFSYLGRWQEKGRTFHFLQRDDRSFKVEQPGPLDGDYAVQAIDEQGLRLRYLPLDQVQELRFDAPPAAAVAAQAAAQPAQPAPAAEPDKAEN